MKILVTGGLGYIGSHVTVLLLESGVEVISIDNLDNSHIEVLEGIKAIVGKKPVFELLDLKDKDKTQDLFKKHQNIDGVIHFAAYKAVGESTEDPLKYYKNNIGGLLNLLESLCELNIPLIFSSSCTVYGQASKLPIEENTPLKSPSSPYGYTKQVGEQIIKDSCEAHLGFKAVLLRYFNPVGAHESALIGELPKGIPDNLVPYITQTAAGIREGLSVFGKDYNTHDGTAIRDYIHVEDLAKAHLKAFNFLNDSEDKNIYEFFNVGTGIGYSVLDVINSFENVNNLKLNYSFKDRRDGDIEKIYSDVIKSKKVLKWESERSLDDMMSSAWKWQKNLK